MDISDPQLYLEDSEADNSGVSNTSSTKARLEIEIIDPRNEKKFEELAAKDEKLKTYKRRHSGDLETPTKRAFEECGSGTDDDDSDEDQAKPLKWSALNDDKEDSPAKDRYWKHARGRVPSESSEATASSTSKGKPELETDPDVLSRRQKQIDFGKNTVGYDNYRKKVPRYHRVKNEHPKTPPMHLKYSRRAWDGLIKIWRKKLHEYDDKPDKVEDKKL